METDLLNKEGALPSQRIRALIREGRIKGGKEENVQPASLDLTAGEEIYRLPSIFLPRSNEKVESVAEETGATKYTFDYPLEVNTPYLVKLKEELNLPDDVYAYSNPKSSSGRNDLRVTMVADNIGRFDSINQKGYKGGLWAIIEPKSYRIKIQPGDALLQIRFFYSDTRLKYGELENFFKKHSPLYGRSGEVGFERISKFNDFDGGLILSVNLHEELVGWRCGGTTSKFLDFSKRNEYDPLDFFEPILKPKNNRLILRKGDFYIFYTRQRIVVPPDYALEMASVDSRNGEYRSHYAGFIDPGWGYSENDGAGAPLVLEIRPFEDNLLLRDRQPICKVVYEKMAERPDILYGRAAGSHYSDQNGPRLSKHFRRAGL